MFAAYDSHSHAGHSIPSQRTIARECGVTIDAVRVTSRKLGKRGVLRQEERLRANKSRTSNHTWLRYEDPSNPSAPFQLVPLPPVVLASNALNTFGVLWQLGGTATRQELIAATGRSTSDGRP